MRSRRTRLGPERGYSPDPGIFPQFNGEPAPILNARNAATEALEFLSSGRAILDPDTTCFVVVFQSRT